MDLEHFQFVDGDGDALTVVLQKDDVYMSCSENEYEEYGVLLTVQAVKDLRSFLDGWLKSVEVGSVDTPRFNHPLPGSPHNSHQSSPH